MKIHEGSIRNNLIYNNINIFSNENTHRIGVAYSLYKL